MRAHPRCLPVFALSLGLGACQFLSVEPVVDVPATEVQADIVADTPEPEPEEIAALPPVEPEVAPPPPIPVPAPDTLVGYTMTGLEGLFGEPNFLRRDPPAELWQYHSKSCVLDLFLYENSGGSYQVTHVEFRETGRSSDEKETCLRDIIVSSTGKTE